LDRSLEKGQGTSTNPNFVFNTTNVTLKLVDGLGNDLSGTGSYRIGGGSWMTFGSGTTPSNMELIGLGYGFRVVYNGDTYAKYQNVASNPIVEFVVPSTQAKVDDGSLNEEPNVEVTLGVYPNPFSEYTNFTFSLDETTDVRLVIYDLSGKVIKTLADREFEQGTNQVQWNGTNDAGAPVAVGVYFYRMEAGEFVKTDRVVVTK
jgi:hypothetical protein